MSFLRFLAQQHPYIQVMGLKLLTMDISLTLTDVFPATKSLLQ